MSNDEGGASKKQLQVFKEYTDKFMDRSSDDIEMCDLCSMEYKLSSIYLVVRIPEDGDLTPVNFYVCQKCVDTHGMDAIEEKFSDFQ